MDAIENDDFAEAKYAKDDLLIWLNAGGFEPSWSDDEEKFFTYWDSMNPTKFTDNN